MERALAPPDCWQELPVARPCFDEIKQRLICLRANYQHGVSAGLVWTGTPIQLAAGASTSCVTEALDKTVALETAGPHTGHGDRNDEVMRNNARCKMLEDLAAECGLAAICSNGEVKGGGAYFVISRALGPSHGGTIGVMYSLATAAVVALHLLGFSEVLKNLLFPNPIVGDGSWDVSLLSLCSLCVVALIVVLGGLAAAAKAQLLLLVLLVSALVSSFVGAFAPPDHDIGFTGWNKETFIDNLGPRWEDGENFMTLFGVFFPAATGIMAGANISGDLSNPTRAHAPGECSSVVPYSSKGLGYLSA
eukprot:g17859.t1